MKKRQELQPSALQFYWYEIKSSEALGSMWGQFMGAIHRLADIDEELMEASRQRDVLRRLHRITQIIESFLYRAYELRERAVNLLGAITAQPALAKSSKSPNKRARSLRILRPAHPDLVDGIDRLLALLDNDMLLRNMHTHKQFLGIGLWAPNGPYNPDDILMELEHRPREHRKMVSLLRAEMRKLVDEHQTRISSLFDAAWAVAKAADAALKVANAAHPHRASRL